MDGIAASGDLGTMRFGASAPSLSAAELEALLAAGVSLDGPPGDPWGVGAVERGQAVVDEFLRSSLTVREVADLLCGTARGVRRLISAGELAAVRLPSGYVLPRWQFIDGTRLPNLAPVLEAAGGVHPLALATFMTTENLDLEVAGARVSPREWMHSGRDVGVVADLVTGLSIAS